MKSSSAASTRRSRSESRSRSRSRSRSVSPDRNSNKDRERNTGRRDQRDYGDRRDRGDRRERRDSRDRDRDRDRGKDRNGDRDSRSNNKDNDDHGSGDEIKYNDNPMHRQRRTDSRDRRDQREDRQEDRNGGGRDANSRNRGNNNDRDRRQPRKSEYTASSSSAPEQWGNSAKEYEFDQSAKAESDANAEKEKEKVKANFGLSGALAKDDRTGNMLNGVLLKFNEPLDAAIPTKNWRLYVFKDSDVVEVLHLHRKSYYLIGRDQRIADIHTAHPSCSKQHAVIQFRSISRIEEDPRTHNKIKISEVKPYLMDLGSAHKTTVNGSEVEEARYYQLLEKDCLKFGQSSREYVILHEESTK
jgi:smad nuclear-interacting protein 1